jgi:hypothetical protein
MNKLIVLLVIILLFVILCLNKNEQFVSKYPFIKDLIFNGHKPCKKCKRPGNSCSMTRH